MLSDHYQSINFPDLDVRAAVAAVVSVIKTRVPYALFAPLRREPN